MTTTADVRNSRNAHIAARYRKRKALAELRGIPVAPIPAAPLRQHVNRLLTLGWGSPAIIATARVDGSPTGLLLIANGHSVRAERKWAPVLNLPYSLAVSEHVPDDCLVPSLGAVRRIRALMALGWRHEDVTPLIGGRSSSHLASHRHKTINAHDWRLVDAAYQHLAAVPGPSAKSRKRAAAKGYVPPLAWDDIDDPDETPTGHIADERPPGPDDVDDVVVARVLGGDWRLPCTPAEKAEVARRFVEAGGTTNTLSRRTGWKVERYYRIGDAA